MGEELNSIYKRTDMKRLERYTEVEIDEGFYKIKTLLRVNHKETKPEELLKYIIHLIDDAKEDDLGEIISKTVNPIEDKSGKYKTSSKVCNDIYYEVKSDYEGWGIHG